MKRIIAVLCIVLALGMMMSACGESSSSNKGGAGTQVDVSLQKIFDEVKEEVDFPEMVEYTSADQLDRRYGITEDMIDDYAGGIEAASVTTNEIVLVRAKDDGEDVRILAKMDKKFIKDVIIAVSGHDDCSLIQLSGKFLLDDVMNIIKEENKD